jgi:GWxTD domain-containing protein
MKRVLLILLATALVYSVAPVLRPCYPEDDITSDAEPAGAISSTPPSPAESKKAYTERELKRMIGAHPDSALPHARLAGIYFRTGTPEGRAQAVKYLKQALKIEPDNTDFRRLLAEVYFEGTFWNYGVEELRTVLETDSHNGHVRYRLGKAYMERAFEVWQQEWFIGAETHLAQVGQDHPAYPAAARQLALCYYDLGKPDSSVAVLKAVPGDSLDADAFLLLGMAKMDIKDLPGADQAFTAALDEMDDVRLARYLSPDLIATKAELKELRGIPEGDTRRRGELYWRKRNPNLANKINERFLIHVSRVAFADFHFSVPRLGRAGSETSRGEVFLRYGKPVSWFYDPFGTNVFCDETIAPTPGMRPLSSRARMDPFFDMGFAPRSRPLRMEKPRWLWQYPGFVLEFEDTFLNGDFTFPYERDWSAYTYAYLEKKIPEIYESQIKKRMRVVLDALNLMGPRGGTYVKINYACDTRGIDYIPDFEWPKGEFDIEITVLDSIYRDIARTRFSAELFADSSAMYQTSYPLIGSQIVEVPPGRTVAAVSLESRANGAIGFSSGGIVARQFGDSLEMSDLELRFDRDGPPNPSHIFLRRGEAYLGFIIYNLTRDDAGIGEAEVSYEIARIVEQPGIVRRMLAHLIGESDEDSGTVASLWSSYELRTEGSTAREVLGIDLSPLSSGTYRIVVTVTDKANGKVVAGATQLRIASELEL